MHIVEFLDGFESLHNMEGLVHAEFHFLFGDHAQAGFFWLNEQRAGILAEFGVTQQIFTSPADRRTEDYITGRFG